MIENYTKENSNVRFVEYTGSYPNLCSGTLTLCIDGIKYKFGRNVFIDEEVDYPNRFWKSGGSCGFRGRYDDEYVEQEEWIIDYKQIPDQFKKYAEQIDKVFNANVRYGCCGGCL